MKTNKGNLEELIREEIDKEILNSFINTASMKLLHEMRAASKAGFIKRHGKEKGLKLWAEYIEKQKSLSG